MRLDAPGLYALEPSAFGVDQLVDCARNMAAPQVVGAVAVIGVHGLLTYSGATKEGPTASYDDVVRRTREAFALPGVHTVVAHLDSPGGDVAGAFDAARRMRAAVPQGGRLVAYVDSKCCSAAYALACAATEIHASSTAILGSVGVIFPLKSAVAAEAALGLQTVMVTSGARKADGNPSVPITPEAQAATQTLVDVMAGEFFRLVAESRGALGLTADAARALEAGVFVGQAAVAAKLCDGVVESLDALVSSLQVPPMLLTQPAAATPSEESMPDDDKKDPPKEDATRASLVTASQSDDPEKAARAKRALASYDSDESDDSDKKDEKPSSADDKEEPKSAAAVAQLAARVQALSADLAARDARDAAAEASAFYAGCSHLDGELVATLKALPLAHAKAIVAKLPKAPSAAAVLAAVPGFVPGDGQGEGSAMRSAPEEQARINAAFGETSATLAKAEFNGATNIQTFGRVTVAPKGK